MANHTLNLTFKQLSKGENNSNINYINIFNKLRFIFKDNCVFRRKKIKIITAVRDPIARNLFMVFRSFQMVELLKNGY